MVRTSPSRMVGLSRYASFPVPLVSCLEFDSHESFQCSSWCVCDKWNVMLQVRRGVERWQREDDERS